MSAEQTRQRQDGDYSPPVVAEPPPARPIPEWTPPPASEPGGDL